MSALDDALATLADPTSTPASRLGAASIVQFEVASLRERNTQLGLLRVDAEAGVDRVRALHGVKVTVPGDEEFAQCLHCAGDWPCATRRALDGES